MSAGAKSTIVLELVAEFVEERVRHCPGRPFDLGDATRAVHAALREAGHPTALGPRDKSVVANSLNQHPFLLRSQTGPVATWTPGLKKRNLRPA